MNNYIIGISLKWRIRTFFANNAISKKIFAKTGLLGNIFGKTNKKQVTEIHCL